MMLRTVVLLLALGNVLFFAWTQGVLPDPVMPLPGVREPDRMARQLHPERVQLIGPAAARAALAAARPEPSPATTCVEAGPFGPTEIDAAERLAGALPAGSWQRVSSERAAGFAVYMGRFPDLGAAEARQAELQTLQVEAEPVRWPPELAPGLSLSRHDNRRAAEAALDALARQGVRRMRVVELPRTPRHWLRIEPVTVELLARAAALTDPGLGDGFRPCADR